MQDGRSDPHAADVLARPHQRERPPHHLVRRRQHPADPPARRQFLRARRSARPTSSGRSTRATRSCGPRPAWSAPTSTHAPAHSPKYRYSGRGDAAAARRAAAPDPTARARMRYTNPATGGAVMPALDCYAVRLPKDADDAAEAHHLQHDLPRGVRRRPLDRRRARRSTGRSTTCSRFRTGPGPATRAKDGDADLFIVSDKVGVRAPRPAARGTAISHAPSEHRRAKASARRCGASRIRSSCAASGRFVADITLPGELHCVLVRSPHAHARIRSIDTATRGQRCPASSPCSPAPTWRPTSVGPMAPLWAITSRRRQADGGAAALGAGARHGAARRRAGRRGDRGNAGAGAGRGRAGRGRLRAAARSGRRRARRCAPDAPQLHDSAPGNVCFRFARGDEAAVRKAFDGAAHVVSSISSTTG